jgi:hypothetical protein
MEQLELSIAAVVVVLVLIKVQAATAVQELSLFDMQIPSQI